MPQPYLSLEAELHDAFWEAEDPGSEVALMAGFLKKFPGPALELGAGSGRLLIPLLEMGFAVEGLELSPDMISLGERRAAASGIAASIHHGDMATWQGGPFAALLAPAFTLQLADDPAAALHHWHSLLIPGGGLYLSVFIPYAELLGDLPENEWYPDHAATLSDGREGRLETRHHLYPEQRLLKREHRYSLTGNPPQSHVSSQTLHWFEHAEMLALLTNNGFAMERFYLDFDPTRTVTDPDAEDFDGILTYEAIRAGKNNEIS